MPDIGEAFIAIWSSDVLSTLKRVATRLFAIAPIRRTADAS